MGYFKNFGIPWMPMLPFSSGAIVLMDRVNIQVKFEVRSFTRS